MKPFVRFQQVRRSPIVTILALALVSGFTLSASGAEPGPPVDDDGVGVVPSLVTESELTAAEPLFPKFSGISAEYPDSCTDVVTEQREMIDGSVDGDRIDIGPPTVEAKDVVPGTTYRSCVMVHNRAGEPATFELEGVDIVGSPKPDQKQELIAPVTVGAWIHPTVATFSLEPGERINIPYVVAVPDESLGGVVSGGLVIRRTTAESKSSGAGVQLSLVHRLLLNFPGGEAKPLDISDIRAPRVLSRADGKSVYPLRFVAKNEGTVVETYTATLKMDGLGRSVSSTERQPSILLPEGAEKVLMQVTDMPWIGIYTPKLTIKDASGTRTESLPKLLVLPSTPVTVLLLAAILLPIAFLLWRWYRRRSEWRQYLEDSEEEDLDGAEHEDQFSH